MKNNDSISNLFEKLNEEEMVCVDGGSKKHVNAELFIDSNVMSVTALKKRPPIYELPVVRPVKM